MAHIEPFRGVRYSADAVGDLAAVLSPPYDVIDAAGERALLSKNPHNIIRVELFHVGLEAAADPARYEEAGAILRGWLDDEVLIRDVEPSYYVYEQSYVGPDGKARTRRGFFARVRLEDPAQGGAIRPHERTLSGPKADRLALMNATHANVSPIFGLFENASGEVGELLERATRSAPIIRAESADDIIHTLWRLNTADECAQLTRSLSDQKIYIADGHHRYETALNYQSQQRTARTEPPGATETSYDYVMMMLCEVSDPGLAVFPIHRLVKLGTEFDAQTFRDKLEPFFSIKSLGNEPTVAEATAAIGGGGLAAYGPKIGGGYALSPKPELAAQLKLREVTAPLDSLDIVALHTVILEALDVSFEAGSLTFIHDAEDAFAGVDTGEFDVAFLLNATRIDDLRNVVEAGLTMPQKSTFFYPKPATGLVLNLLS